MTDGEPVDYFDDTDFLKALQEIDGFPVDHLPSTFDLTGPAVERWVQPPLPLEVELDHLVGGNVLDVLPTKAEDGESRELDREIRRLPRPLGSTVHALNYASHRADLVAFIENEVRRLVAPAALRYVEVPGALYKTSYLPEIHRRAVLTRFAADKPFVIRLKSRVDEIKRQGHLVNTYGDSPTVAPELPACAVPSIGPWNAESWLGLSTSSLPESMPEEVVVAITQRMWRRYRYLRGKTRKLPVGRVLHWGALNGTLAFALTSTAPVGLTLVIHEVDTVGQPQSREWLGQRFTSLPEHVDYDLVVVHAPPPGEGANHIRNRYKNIPSSPEDELHLEDLGRQGTRKWRRGVLKLIREVMPKVRPNGELVLLLPVAVRTAPRVEGYVQWGYEPRANLLDGVVELVVDGGFGLFADLAVVEKNPLNQPFFVDRRCPWRFVIAARPRSTELDSDDSVDALLAGLEADLG